MAKRLLKIYTLWSIGALTYGAMEVLARGFTHISMGILGGICLLLIDLIDKNFKDKIAITMIMLISATIITVLEFCTGLIVNIWLNLDVWDYSRAPLNLYGQICVPFTGIWFLLSFFAIHLKRIIEWKIFCEEKPQFKLLKKPVLLKKAA